MAEISVKCFACGNEMKYEAGTISRRDECPKCRADVRTCKNCRFYDPKVYNECKETNAEVIREKDRSNLCDYFFVGSGGSQEKSKDDLRAAAEALFKKN